MIKRWLRRNTRAMDLEAYDFDAFVVFSEEHDSQWVFNILRLKVENEWGLSLCLLGCNDLPGSSKADVIVEGIGRKSQGHCCHYQTPYQTEVDV